MQLALVYDAAHVGASDWDEELKWFRRAVDVLGHKEVAYRLDVQPSNLTDALLERERKDVKGRWISVVRRMVPDALLADYVRIVTVTHGYEFPKRLRARTPEETNRETRDWLEKNAPAVLSVMDKELGR
jgi:hypothetical protein